MYFLKISEKVIFIAYVYQTEDSNFFTIYIVKTE